MLKRYLGAPSEHFFVGRAPYFSSLSGVPTPQRPGQKKKKCRPTKPSFHGHNKKQLSELSLQEHYRREGGKMVNTKGP